MVVENEVTVTAPARIHFGLISVGRNLQVNFGGCGLMVQDPALRITLKTTSEDRWEAVDELPLKIQRYLARCRELYPARYQSGVTIKVQSLPPRHSGFGTGTQLAMSVGAGLHALWGLPGLKPEELAMLFDRGMKSAIGTHGFFLGGFLVDRGIEVGERLSPLGLRLDFPEWPILLVKFPELAGLHGTPELSAFDQLVTTTPAERAEMEEIVREAIVPGIASRNFSQFADAINVFGERSGRYYERIQQGPFHSTAVAEVVEACRKLGDLGVVQSSWGPTLAIFGNDPHRMIGVAQELSSRFPNSCFQSTRAANFGAQITRKPSGSAPQP